MAWILVLHNTKCSVAKNKSQQARAEQYQAQKSFAKHGWCEYFHIIIPHQVVKFCSALECGNSCLNCLSSCFSFLISFISVSVVDIV